MENNEKNNLLINDNENINKEKDIEENIEKGEFFYGNDYCLYFNSL